MLSRLKVGGGLGLKGQGGGGIGGIGRGREGSKGWLTKRGGYDVVRCV